MLLLAGYGRERDAYKERRVYLYPPDGSKVDVTTLIGDHRINCCPFCERRFYVKDADGFTVMNVRCCSRRCHYRDRGERVTEDGPLATHLIGRGNGRPEGERQRAPRRSRGGPDYPEPVPLGAGPEPVLDPTG